MAKLYHRFHPKDELCEFLKGTYRSREPIESFTGDAEWVLMERQRPVDGKSRQEVAEEAMELLGKPCESVTPDGGTVIMPGVFAYPSYEPGDESEYWVRPSGSGDVLVEFEGEPEHLQSTEREEIVMPKRLISIKDVGTGLEIPLAEAFAKCRVKKGEGLNK